MDYFLLRPNGEQTGTFSFDQVKAMQRTGFIGPEVHYWHEGLGAWQPVERIEESLKYVSTPPPSTSVAPGIKLPLGKGTISPLMVKSGKTSLPGLQAKASAVAEPPKQPSAPPPKQQPTWTPEFSLPRTDVIPRAEAIPEREEEVEQESAPVVVAVHERRRPATWKTYALYVVPMVLLTAAIVFAAVHRRSVKNSAPTEVILTGNDTYVLTDQGSIRTLAQDLQVAPVSDALQVQIDQATDPETQEKLKIGVERERARHVDEVKMQYIQSGRAQLIEPGTYKIVATLDDQGALILPRVGGTWVAIAYKNSVLYAHKTPEPVTP